MIPQRLIRISLFLCVISTISLLSTPLFADTDTEISDREKLIEHRLFLMSQGAKYETPLRFEDDVVSQEQVHREAAPGFYSYDSGTGFFASMRRFLGITDNRENVYSDWDELDVPEEHRNQARNFYTEDYDKLPIDEKFRRWKEKRDFTTQRPANFDHSSHMPPGEVRPARSSEDSHSRDSEMKARKRPGQDSTQWDQISKAASVKPSDRSVSARQKDQENQPTYSNEPSLEPQFQKALKSDFVPEPVSSGGQFSMGTEAYYYSYEEPNFMEQDGYMYGINAAYTYRSSGNAHVRSMEDALRDSRKLNMYRLEGMVAYGSLNYDSNGTGWDDGIDNYMTDLRALAGYDFHVGQRKILTPYFGLGFRYLFDDGGGRQTSTGHFGYDRESQYGYVPIGVEYLAHFETGWSLGVNVEYDWIVKGKQSSHLEDVDPLLGTLENDQDDGYGVRGSVRLTRRGRRANVFFEPFIRYWDVEDSTIEPLTYNGQLIFVGEDTVMAGLEPANKTIEYGFKIGAEF